MASCTLRVGAQEGKDYNFNSGTTLQGFFKNLGVVTNGQSIKVNGMTVCADHYKLKSGDLITLVKNAEGNR
jgi:sulfur carrier protein ThiS